MSRKYTFWKLIEQYYIEIPIIQRDYAQGRKSDRIDAIRENFLDNVYEAIDNNDISRDFDFVYGSIEKYKDSNKLIPLDGQQRLTTFFLLHWYLATKDGVVDDVKEILCKFSYETRISSREFCQGLVNCGIDINEIGKGIHGLSEIIKDSAWFYTVWKNDPTISSMLVMLDAIHNKFKDSQGFFEKLKREVDGSKLCPITFSFLDLKELKLSDDLYIKMNARGKVLTDFENFKAKFEQHLEKNFSEKVEFYKKKMDNDWTELFWRLRNKENNDIDNPFMRYIYYITEMLYVLDFETQKREKSPFLYEKKDNTPKVYYPLIYKVYSQEKNVEYLFSSIDILCDIGDIDNFFDDIFDLNCDTNKVSMYGSKINLIACCLDENEFLLTNKILLFTILMRCISLKKTIVDEDLKDYVRVIRNMISRIRFQQNSKFSSDLRFDTLRRILSSINMHFVKDKNVYEILFNDNVDGFVDDNHEILKANIINQKPALKKEIHALEDNELFKGSIHNCINETTMELIIKNSEIEEVWSCETQLIIRSLLSVGEFYITIGSSDLGARRFFGNENDWHTVLTKEGKDSERIKTTLKDFIDKYRVTNKNTNEEKLQLMIDEYLYENTTKDWKYYFVKYPQIIRNKYNAFAWKNDYENRSLESGFSLLTKHRNPYAKVLANLLDNNICKEDDTNGFYSDLAPLKLKNGTNLFCNEKGWKISFSEDVQVPNDINTYKDIEVVVQQKEYLLKESGEDRIEQAKQFIEYLYK